MQIKAFLWDRIGSNVKVRIVGQRKVFQRKDLDGNGSMGMYGSGPYCKRVYCIGKARQEFLVMFKLPMGK